MRARKEFTLNQQKFKQLARKTIAPNLKFNTGETRSIFSPATSCAFLHTMDQHLAHAKNENCVFSVGSKFFRVVNGNIYEDERRRLRD
jgi:hypothetical protein